MGQQLLDLGRCSDDPRCLLAGLIALGTSEFYLGQLATARDHLAQAAAIADNLADPSLLEIFSQDPRVGSRNVLALATCLLGDGDEAEAIVAEQTRLLAAIDHPPTQLMGGSRTVVLAAAAGRRAGAGRLRAGHRAGRGARVPAGPGRGQDAARVGPGPAGLRRRGAAMLRRSLQALDAAGLVAARPCFLGLLAEAELLDGRPEAALATIDAALAEVARRNDRFYLPELHRLQGEILSARRRDGGAEPGTTATGTEAAPASPGPGRRPTPRGRWPSGTGSRSPWRPPA